MMLNNRLRHRIDIQERVTVQSSSTGAVTTSWENVILDDGTELEGVPAEVLTGPGREFNQSGSEQAEISARINVRWFPGLTQKMRIMWDGNIFNIHSIEADLTARREYRLKCTTGVNDGQ